MKKIEYSNQYESYDIIKLTTEGRTKWYITQDGVFASNSYDKLKDAKKAIDNQEVYF